jgi:hypothetical protein
LLTLITEHLVFVHRITPIIQFNANVDISFQYQ